MVAAPALLSVRALAVGLLIASCLTHASAQPAPGPPETKVVYLVSHGWHVGLAVARADVSPRVWPEVAEARGRFVEIGWGDGAYYPAPEATVGMGLRAAVSSEFSVLHVAAFDPAPAEFFAGAPVVRVPLSAAGFEALTRFIHAHYEYGADGRPVVVAPGRYGDARFYRATGRYRLFDNSNTWAAKALHAAGCPIDPATITAGSVVRQAKELETVGCR
ncbi:MAG: DUF2459 domain-containing protein [Candidatus Rokubacteria bacterium]|nr:DUF2459 domain-containing protein [Candidatus Rokubacteria bacterium]